MYCNWTELNWNELNLTKLIGSEQSQIKEKEIKFQTEQKKLN